MRPGSLSLEVVELGDGGASVEDVLVHDATDPVLAGLLAALRPPEFPVALGVLYDSPAPSYERQVHARETAATRPNDGSLNALLRSGPVWTVD